MNHTLDLEEKRLALESWSGRSLQKRKRISPVTIVSAIICRDAIIMASDSRTTNEDSTIRDDTKKVYAIRLQGHHGFLIGQSGNDDLGTQAIEIIGGLAKQATLKDYRSCAELAEEAIKQLKQKIRGQFHGTAEELQKHFENHDFSLMLAHYYKVPNPPGKIIAPRPYIFTVRFSLGMARIQDKSFASIGCGSPLADFILSGFNVSDFDFCQATATAVFTVEQVKKFDPRCGGRTQVGSAERFFGNTDNHICNAMLVDDVLIKDFVNGVAEAENELKIQQHKTMLGIMERVNRHIAPRLEQIKLESGGVYFGMDGSINPYKSPEIIAAEIEAEKNHNP